MYTNLFPLFLSFPEPSTTIASDPDDAGCAWWSGAVHLFPFLSIKLSRPAFLDSLVRAHEWPWQSGTQGIRWDQRDNTKRAPESTVQSERRTSSRSYTNRENEHMRKKRHRRKSMTDELWNEAEEQRTSLGTWGQQSPWFRQPQRSQSPWTTRA